MLVNDLNVIAIIPARGGSKRIHKKNLLRLAGRPLVAHSILHAKQSQYIRKVYVSTDDADIARVASEYGAEVIIRPPELATDTASSELALLHVLDELNKQGQPDPELVVFLQPTSPIRHPLDIDRAIETLREKNFDSVFSARRDHGLFWSQRNGEHVPMNYDFKNRKMEQQWEGQMRENGSIYVFRPEILRQHNSRMGGKIGIYEMELWHSFQLDSAEDLALFEWIISNKVPVVKRPFPKQIDLIVFDFDGVMTDNRVLVDENGKESVWVNRADGMGIKMLKTTDIPALVLSTEKNPVVAARCKKLKLECIQGSDNKQAELQSYLIKNNISAENVVYVGNDINDLGCFGLAGFTVAVADSDPRILSRADLVLTKNGGGGAVREFCELVKNSFSGG